MRPWPRASPHFCMFPCVPCCLTHACSALHPFPASCAAGRPPRSSLTAPRRSPGLVGRSAELMCPTAWLLLGQWAVRRGWRLCAAARVSFLPVEPFRPPSPPVPFLFHVGGGLPSSCVLCLPPRRLFRSQSPLAGGMWGRSCAPGRLAAHSLLARPPALPGAVVCACFHTCDCMCYPATCSGAVSVTHKAKQAHFWLLLLRYFRRRSFGSSYAAWGARRVRSGA